MLGIGVQLQPIIHHVMSNDLSPYLAQAQWARQHVYTDMLPGYTVSHEKHMHAQSHVHALLNSCLWVQSGSRAGIPRAYLIHSPLVPYLLYYCSNREPLEPH